MARGVVGMDEPFARGAIEQPHGEGVRFGCGWSDGRTHVLYRGAQRRALRAVPDLMRSGLAHGLLGGFDSGQTGLLVSGGR